MEAPPGFVDDGVTGLLIDPQDVPGMGERIAGLLAAPDQREAMGPAGAAAVQGFTWERVARHYDQLYGALMSP